MINIQDIIPFMKDGWVAMDEDKEWFFYKEQPQRGYCMWSNYGMKRLSDLFDIAPADDWTKSLIRIKGKDNE